MRGLLLGLAVLGGAVPAGGAGAPASVGPPPSRHVVVVGVAGLRWSDVSGAATPRLASIVDGGAAGALSVRTAPAPPHVTCPGDGWLTLGAGSYAAVADPSTVDDGCAGRQPLPMVADPPGPRTGAGARIPALADVYRLNTGLRFGARPGTLGEAVPCATAVGPGAALAVADRYGTVDRYAATLPAGPAALFARCPLTVVDLGALPSGAGRGDALAGMDRALGTVVDALPAGGTVLVTGVAGSVGDPAPRLHVAALGGAGVRPGWLRSPSTRRAPYLQLSDIAPTVLDLLGHDVPPGLAGLPVRGGGPGRPEGVDATAAALVDLDRAAAAQRAAVGPFFAWYGGLALLVLLAAVAVRRRVRPSWTVGTATLVLAAVPAGTFLANLVPWWRAPHPTVTAFLATVAAASLVGAIGLGVARTGPGRRRPGRAVVAVAAVTTTVLAVDAVTGATLQINSMLGYNPLVAGRFVGFGNLAFAVFATASVLVVAAVAGVWRHRFGPRSAAAAAAVAGTAVLAVDGAPAWGADVGGVLTLVPVFALLVLLTAGARIRSWRLPAAAALGVLVAAGIGVLDATRPVRERSHVGRFVAGVGDGSARATVVRKLDANLDLLLAGPHTVAVLLLAVALTVWVLRGPAALTTLYATHRWLRPALQCVVAAGWIAFATNDSGVAIPLVVALIAVPAVAALHAWRDRTAPGPPGAVR